MKKVYTLNVIDLYSWDRETGLVFSISNRHRRMMENKFQIQTSLCFINEMKPSSDSFLSRCADLLLALSVFVRIENYLFRKLVEFVSIVLLLIFLISNKSHQV